MSEKLLIAIDGPSASGKGSLAQKIANHYDLAYLNTGALYRIAALRYLQMNLNDQNFEENIFNLVQGLDQEDFENPQLFTEVTGETASKIAKNQKLRSALFDFQQDFIKKGVAQANGVIMDGRDIASVIMPQADFKFFVTADVAVRAQRRFLQLQKKGDNVSFDEILHQLKVRDDNDLHRTKSPLKIDEEAIIIDNSALDQGATLLYAIDIIEKNKS